MKQFHNSKKQTETRMITVKIMKPYINKKANLSDWNGGW